MGFRKIVVPALTLNVLKGEAKKEEGEPHRGVCRA